jgi:type II secretion system protein G
MGVLAGNSAGVNSSGDIDKVLNQKDVAKLESKTGVEYPLAKREGVIEEPIGEEKADSKVLVELESRPPRPNMMLQDAIDAGNVREVWAHIYHKTSDFQKDISWLIYALIDDADERIARYKSLMEADVSLTETMFYTDKIYNRTKSNEFNQIIRLLVDNGADVNRKGSYNVTPLGIAVKSYNIESINLLVTHGAKITPHLLDIAMRMKSVNNLIGYLSKNADEKDVREAIVREAEFEKLVAEKSEKSPNERYFEDRATGTFHNDARDVELLRDAVMQFRYDEGRYPTPEEGLKVLLKYVRTSEMLKNTAGYDYVYVPNSQSGFDFEIISLGYDGKRSQDDVIAYGKYGLKGFDGGLKGQPNNSVVAASAEPSPVEIAKPVANVPRKFNARELPQINVALKSNGALATATNYGTYGESQYPHRAIDGDPKTGWSSDKACPAWLKVEFDKVYKINAVALRTGSHQHDFTISLSMDGVNWTMVVNRRTSRNSEAGPPTNEYFTIPWTDAKFIQIDILTTSAPESHFFYSSVGELEAYACKDSDTELPNEDPVVATKKTMKMLHNAVMQFKMDTGEYPSQGQGLNVLVKASSGTVKFSDRTYIDSVALPKDAWGNDFAYVLYPQSGKPYAIASFGPDGKKDTEDDLWSTDFCL